MKNLFFVLCLATVFVSGCKKDKGGQPTVLPGDEPSIEVVTAPAPAQDGIRREDFPFDQLFEILSSFGGNIMTVQFAPQSVKDQIRPELQEYYKGYREFNGNACNLLAYTFFNDGCTDGMNMGCWKYDADGHILVLIAEEGGCDVCSTKYIRAYDYDPATKNAHEVDIPLEPAPQYEDFNDIIRLAGADNIPSVRKAMRERRYNYIFSPEGLTVQLNTTDEYEVAGSCGFDLFYRWNGSAFVRDESVPFQCINGEGFALIKLGEPMPDMNVGGDKQGYDIRYSEGGDLWLVDRGGQRVLEVQMEDGKVYSIEVFDPRYSLQGAFFWDGRGRVAVGSRIGDYFDFTKEGAPEVQIYSDGTVEVVVENFDARIGLRTGKDDPRNNPAATIQSILISKINP